MKIQLPEGNIVGAYECSYDRRCIYLIRAKTNVEAFFMTKKNWRIIEQDNPEMFQFLRRRTLLQFKKIHKTLE